MDTDEELIRQTAKKGSQKIKVSVPGRALGKAARTFGINGRVSAKRLLVAGNAMMATRNFARFCR